MYENFRLTDEPEPCKEGDEFQNGNFMRGLRAGDFLCELYELHGPVPDPTRNTIGYRLYDFGATVAGLIFEGREFSVPAGTCIDDPRCFVDLLGFLSLKEHDVEPEYFLRHEYTRRQMAWRDERAEILGMIQCDLEEMHSSIWNDDIPAWACTKYEDDEHEWMNCANCQAHYDREVFEQRPFSPIYMLVSCHRGEAYEPYALVKLPDETYDSTAKKRVEELWVESDDDLSMAEAYEWVLKRLVEEGYEWIPLAQVKIPM